MNNANHIKRIKLYMLFVGDVGKVLNKWEGKLLIFGLVLFPIIKEIQKSMHMSNKEEFLV